MFTVKATYRGETRKFTFPDSTVFPSFHQIYLQLYRVFPISHNYYLSKLLFSPDSAVSKSRILLAREIHGEEDYSRAIASHAGTKAVWSDPLLKFFVYEETPHKLPALSSPFSSSYSVASTSTPVASVVSTHSPGGAFGPNSLTTPIAFSLIPPPPVIFSSVTPQLHSLEVTPKLPPRLPVSPQLEPKQQADAVHVPCYEELEKIKALVFDMKAELENIQARMDVHRSSDIPPPLPAKPVPVRMGRSCASCAKVLSSGCTFDCARCTAIFCSECGAGRTYFPHVECADGGYQHNCSLRADESCLAPFGSDPVPSPPAASRMSSLPSSTSVYPMLCSFKFCYKCSQLKQGHWYTCESCASNLCPDCKEQDSSPCPFGPSSHGWNKKTCGHCPQSAEPNRAGTNDDAFGTLSASSSSVLPPPSASTTIHPSRSPTLPHTSTSSVPTNMPAVHGGIQCDSCNILPIHGVRHKCLDCPDYDLCTDCIATGGAEAHNPFHEFFELNEPGRVVVHTVYSGQGEREATNSVPPPPPVPEPVTPRQQEPVLHGATCNLCDSRIRGNRYKCVDCPDFDTCEGCFGITAEHHPQHTFVRVDNIEQFIRRTEADRPMHYAICDNCQKGIYGVRFKCMHPQCPDFDLCEDCEAHPIPVHPRNHNFLKVRDPESVMPAVVRAGQSPPIPERPASQIESRRTPSPSPVPPPLPHHYVPLAFDHNESLPTISRQLFTDDYTSLPSQPPAMYDTPSRLPSPVVHEHGGINIPFPPSFVKPPSPFFYAASERSISPPTADYRGHTIVEPPFVQPVPWRRVPSPPVLPTPPHVGGQGKEWDVEDFWKKISADIPVAPSPPPKRVSFPSWTAPPPPPPLDYQLRPLAPPIVGSVSNQRFEAALDDSWPLPPLPAKPNESNLSPEPENIQIAPAAPSLPPLIPSSGQLPQALSTPPTHNSDWDTFKDKYPDWMNTWLLRFAPPTNDGVTLPTPVPSSVDFSAVSAPSTPPLVSGTATQTRILPVEEVKESRVQFTRVSAMEAIEEKERFWGRRGLENLTDTGETPEQKAAEASFEKDLLNAIQASEKLESSPPSCTSPLSVLSPSTLMGELLSQPSAPSRTLTLDLYDILNEPGKDVQNNEAVVEYTQENKGAEVADKTPEEEPLIAVFKQLSFSPPATVPTPLEAKYIDDRSVPDGQVFPPGAEFIKTWRLKNSGDRDWDEKTQVIWVGGDDLGKRKGSVMIGKVAAGDEVDVWTTELKAPECEGRYVGYYRLKDANGTVFGDSIWLDITVKDGTEERQEGESSDEYKSMSSSSVIVMPQAVNDTISRTSSLSMVDNGSENGSASDTSSISLIGSVDSDEEWEDSREQAPVDGDGDEYIVLYDDDSE